MLIAALGWQFQAFLAGFESFRSPLHGSAARVLGYNHWIRIARCSTVIPPSILRRFPRFEGSGSTNESDRDETSCGRANEEQRANRWTSPFLATTSSEQSHNGCERWIRLSSSLFLFLCRFLSYIPLGTGVRFYFCMATRSFVKQQRKSKVIFIFSSATYSPYARSPVRFRFFIYFRVRVIYLFPSSTYSSSCFEFFFFFYDDDVFETDRV